MSFEIQFVFTFWEVIAVVDLASRVGNANGSHALVGIGLTTGRPDAAHALSPFSHENTFEHHSFSCHNHERASTGTSRFGRLRISASATLSDAITSEELASSRLV